MGEPKGEGWVVWPNGKKYSGIFGTLPKVNQPEQNKEQNDKQDEKKYSKQDSKKNIKMFHLVISGGSTGEYMESNNRRKFGKFNQCIIRTGAPTRATKNVPQLQPRRPTEPTEKGNETSSSPIQSRVKTTLKNDQDY